MEQPGKVLSDLFRGWGIPVPETLGHMSVFLGLLVIAWAANYLAKKVLVRLLRLFIEKSRSQWDDHLIRRKVFERLSHIVPALVLYAGAHLAFPEQEEIRDLVKRLSIAYFILVGAVVITSFLNAVVDVYKSFPISRTRPIKAYVQVLQLF